MARVTAVVITREISVGISDGSLAVSPSYGTWGLKCKDALANAVVFKEWRQRSLSSVVYVFVASHSNIS